VGVLWALVVILSGLVAGGALNNAIAMGPALRTFDEPTDLAVRSAWSSDPSRYSTLASLGAALLAVALLIFDGDLRPAVQALLGTAIALSAFVLASNEAARRVERSGRGRTGEDPPAGYAAIRRRWHAAQLAMALASVGMVVCYAIAAGAAS
jgi:hypothetical protein